MRRKVDNRGVSERDRRMELAGVRQSLEMIRIATTSASVLALEMFNLPWELVVQLGETDDSVPAAAVDGMLARCDAMRDDV